MPAIQFWIRIDRKPQRTLINAAWNPHIKLYIYASIVSHPPQRESSKLVFHWKNAARFDAIKIEAIRIEWKAIYAPRQRRSLTSIGLFRVSNVRIHFILTAVYLFANEFHTCIVCLLSCTLFPSATVAVDKIDVNSRIASVCFRFVYLLYMAAFTPIFSQWEIRRQQRMMP